MWIPFTQLSNSEKRISVVSLKRDRNYTKNTIFVNIFEKKVRTIQLLPFEAFSHKDREHEEIRRNATAKTLTPTVKGPSNRKSKL